MIRNIIRLAPVFFFFLIPVFGQKAVDSSSSADSSSAVFVPQIQSQSSVKQEIKFPQDPKLCALLSVTFPGMGQLYQGQFLKSSIMAGLFLVSSSIISNYALINSERGRESIFFRDTNNSLVEIKKQKTIEFGQSELTSTEKAINITAFLAAGGVYVWSIIDTYNHAHAYNRKHFLGTFGQGGRIQLVPRLAYGSQGADLVYRF